MDISRREEPWPVAEKRRRWAFFSNLRKGTFIRKLLEPPPRF
jgi:hypothetical protein